MFQLKLLFNGTFQPNCQVDSVPQYLLALINMVVEGPNIKYQATKTDRNQASLTISQLLVFNCVQHSRGNQDSG